jgi:tripartite-type tricarboxylate transporter receptor subunit TctC
MVADQDGGVVSGIDYCHVPAEILATLRDVLRACAAGFVFVMASAAGADDYPAKPIRIVTMQSGGGDFVARLIAPGLTASLGQQIVVDPRGIIAGEIVAKATPDGYVLLSYGPPFWLLPLMRDHVAYDPVRDFSPITLAASAPNILVVYPGLPVKSVKELIALAKSQPGKLNYGAGSPGSSTQMAAELFNAMAGVSIVRVSYKGTGPALVDLISGQVQVMFPNAGSVRQHLDSGRLKGLAVTTEQPSALAPGLPTLSSSGLPGYESGSPFGIFAPARTPGALITRLNREIVRVLAMPDVKEKFFNLGVETIGSTPEGLASMLKSEITKWGKVVKDAGIHE